MPPQYILVQNTGVDKDTKVALLRMTSDCDDKMMSWHWDRVTLYVYLFVNGAVVIRGGKIILGVKEVLPVLEQLGQNAAH